jgi:hypothetical protein
VIEVSREQVLAHRQAVHGLVERQPRLDALAVLDLGVQNSPPGALQAALSARLAEPLPPSADLTANGALTLAWTLRGAPHLHRTADLPVLAASGWPHDDADAGARLGGSANASRRSTARPAGRSGRSPMPCARC